MDISSMSFCTTVSLMIFPESVIISGFIAWFLSILLIFHFSKIVWEIDLWSRCFYEGLNSFTTFWYLPSMGTLGMWLRVEGQSLTGPDWVSWLDFIEPGLLLGPPDIPDCAGQHVSPGARSPKQCAHTSPLRMQILGPREVAWSVGCLLYKHEDLSLTPIS